METNYTKIFDEILEVIDWNLLLQLTVKLNTDYKVSIFTTKTHLETMILCQLLQVDSLRDFKDTIDESLNLNKLVPNVSLATISNHNNSRDYNVFLPVMNKLIQKALNTIAPNERIKKFGSVKLLDSTTISLCLSYFYWAEFRSTKSGLKMHTVYNLVKGIPEEIIVSNAKESDKSKMEDLITEKYCIYVFDKGYYEYKSFDKYSNNAIFFITRLKDNALYKECQNLEITFNKEVELLKDVELIFDKIVYLGSEYISKTKCPYRIIKIKDKEEKILTFVTNIFDLSSEEIAWLYKKRWEIELFFKWIKQHLKIKTFFGHSFNAVMIQIISAIITFIILRIIEKTSCYSKGLLKLKRKLKQRLTHIVKKTNFNWKNYLS